MQTPSPQESIRNPPKAQEPALHFLKTATRVSGTSWLSKETLRALGCTARLKGWLWGVFRVSSRTYGLRKASKTFWIGGLMLLGLTVWA